MINDLNNILFNEIIFVLTICIYLISKTTFLTDYFKDGLKWSNLKAADRIFLKDLHSQ